MVSAIVSSLVIPFESLVAHDALAEGSRVRSVRNSESNGSGSRARLAAGSLCRCGWRGPLLGDALVPRTSISPTVGSAAHLVSV